MASWIIEATHADERLDVFLTGAVPEHSRSAIQKAIKQGQILVNDAPATVHRFLKTGDRVGWNESAPTETTKTAEALPEPRIIKETADWLVIDKPRGLLTHPSVSKNQPSLVDWFLKHVPQAKQVGEDPSRPGVVHRLDKEVSGLLVLAKTQAAFDALKKAFAQRTVEKRYLALVHGEVPKEEDDIKLLIARSSSKARMAARPPKDGGKAAWTHYKVRERFVGATLLDIEILSGRTHQIRAHLHGIGHPVMGDPIYKRKQTDRNIKQPTRVLLQSIHLAFNDPTTGERETFDIPPDQAFTAMSDFLRNK